MLDVNNYDASSLLRRKQWGEEASYNCKSVQAVVACCSSYTAGAKVVLVASRKQSAASLSNLGVLFALKAGHFDSFPIAPYLNEVTFVSRTKIKTEGPIMG